MLPSLYEVIGLSIMYGDPVWWADRQTGVQLTQEIAHYEHLIEAFGGFKSCTVKVAANDANVMDWFSNGLGRDIKVFNQSGGTVWEGFANRVIVSIGGLSIVRGPLMDVTNRCFVAYTPYLDLTVNPPTRGTPTLTPYAEDTDSQLLWGIQEDIVSGGTLIDATTVCTGGPCGANEALELRDAYLHEYRNPEVSQDLSINVQETSVSIECRGYYDWLTRYIYSNSGTDTTDIPTKMKAVLTADPNGIISTNYDEISDGADYLLPVPMNESDYKKGNTIIEEMVAQGDANDNRTLFAIYENRRAFYKAIPTQIEYGYGLYKEGQRVTTPSGAIIDLWDVRPGRWLEFPDFPTLVPIGGTSLRSDPRNMFIESVRYTAPYGLDLSGSRTGTFKQLLAKKGVGL